MWNLSHVCSCILLMVYKKGLSKYFKCVYVDTPFYFFLKPIFNFLLLSFPFPFTFPLFSTISGIAPNPRLCHGGGQGSPCTTEESPYTVACSWGNLTGTHRIPRRLVLDVFKKVKSKQANKQNIAENLNHKDSIN